MIIDFHTHIFPDKIAGAVLDNTFKALGLPAIAPGTEQGLRDHMRKSGVDLAIVLAVSPDARLVQKTNDWISSLCDDQVQFFGTIHPDLEDWAGELKRLKERGVKGIKFNSLLQGIRPDDPKLFPIYEWMGQEGMIALFHAGGSYQDRHSPGNILATPERIAKVLDLFPNLKVIAAHFGGNHVLDQMKTHLLGRNLYLDTSYPPDVFSLDPGEVLGIIRGHGAGRVLFGTDFPWESAERGIRYLLNLGLTDQEKEGILGENARKLLFD
jgi:predicted TIM-barrel fold metal-dependent hydrolase